MEFVQNAMYDEDDEEEEVKSGKNAKKSSGKQKSAIDYRFSDFFVENQPSKDNGKAKKSAPSKKNSKKSTNADEDDFDSDEFDEDQDEEEEEGDEEEGDIGMGEDDEDDFDEDMDMDEERDDYEDSDEEQQQAEQKAPVAAKPLTSFQNKSKQLSSQIEELEQELVQKKSWEMRGEVKATDRPENSLLGISADIERFVPCQAFAVSFGS